MRLKVITFLVLCLLCVVSSEAQNKIQIVEPEIEARFDNNKLVTSLKIRSPKAVDSAKISLKVLSEKDEVLADSSFTKRLRRGTQSLERSLEFQKLQNDAERLLWYRLSYEVIDKDSVILAKGIVSLSEIMPEVFNLRVIASEDVYAGMKYRVHVLTLHPSTKKPVKNVAVTGFLTLELDENEQEDDINIKASGRTNNEGFASLDFEIPIGAKLDDDGDLAIKAVKHGIKREAKEDIDIPTKSIVYLHTDKPIYQPNQNLFVRGLYLNPQKKPIAASDLEMKITDDDNKTVFQETVETSQFGIANFEWKIPENIKLGKYEIEIESDNGTPIGFSEFKITRYELPNFSVKATPDQSFYTPDKETASIEVTADYLFGKPVTSGRVRIVLDADYGEKIEKEAKISNKENTFSVEFDLSKFHSQLKEAEHSYFEDLEFTAYFTDLTTNRTEQKRFDVRITKDPIHIYFIRQNNDINPNLPYQFYVSTFYADGSPVSADLTIEGNYAGIDPLDKLASAKTNSYGASKFRIEIHHKPFPDAKDKFAFKVTAKDKDGNTGTFENEIYVDDDEDQVFIFTDKTIYKPDEPIYAEIYSSEERDLVMVDVVNDEGVIYSKRVRIERGKGKTRINYSPAFTGELSLAVYSVNDAKYDVTYDSKAIVFPKKNKLDIDVKSLKTVYRPNEEASVKFKVRDDTGRSVETALGIVVLDKAIEERARTERLPDNYGLIRNLLGVGDSFGDLTLRDLNNLDLDKRISKDFQLAAEFLLVNRSFRPNIFENETRDENFQSVYRKYHQEKLDPFKKLLKTHYEKTDEVPRDIAALKQILAKNNSELDYFRDAWDSPFHFEFSTNRNFLSLKIITASGDEVFETDDDFVAGSMKFEIFLGLANRLRGILNSHIESAQTPPETKEELIEIWRKGRVDFSSLKDTWGQPFYIEDNSYTFDTQKKVYETVGNLDNENQQIERFRLLRQQIGFFNLKSMGKDKIRNTRDDFSIGSFSGILKEELISEDAYSVGKITKRSTSNSKGAIAGTIMDTTGAVIPGAIVRVTELDSKKTRTVTTNDIGSFLIPNLPSGKYQVTSSAGGFQTTTIRNVVVSSMNIIELELFLYPAGITQTVEVTSNVEFMVNASSTTLGTTVERSPNSIAGIIGSVNQASTPRVREYFPETLVWKPEIITDKKGRAEIKFKLADSLTTWKFYAIGSTKDGQIEMVEREIRTFQPFFAELDPPKILTEGDEISLPVPVRNYTKKRQKVAVEMAKNRWSNLLNESTQEIEIDADSTTNAIFRFRAETPTENGKQRITATAKSEGDAIEKPVIVKPNGEEKIEPQTKLFEKETSFDVNFPAEAFPETRTAEIKIYPNMISHVAESVEGLLKRPYGCGEQTTSSTYPNLMILRFAKETNYKINEKLKQKAAKYLNDGYKRLLNYQTDSGFGIWSGDDPDVALTAYVLQFLHDAEDFIEVDETVVKKAENWLFKQQIADGSWDDKYRGKDTLTAFIAQTLSVRANDNKSNQDALNGALNYLKTTLSENKDPYVHANFALAAIESKDLETAKAVITKLIENKNSKSNGTAFYGWGKSADIETKALIVQAILKYKTLDKTADTAQHTDEILAFLLGNKDRYGVWHSTQTTINVLNALILSQQMASQGVQNGAKILINGTIAETFDVDNDAQINPFIFDISDKLNQTNRIEITGLKSFAMAQLVSKHYVDWDRTETESSYFDLEVNYDKTNAEIGERIICNVKIKRKVGKYGMILGEIGLPPGADVDRSTLETMVKSNKISRYDVLPDRIVIYAWSGNAEKDFNFAFRMRYGLNAQTPPSFVYDYYNPEAKALVSPTRFEIK